MSYQLRYWSAPIFDAIGDTAAVNLTQHLPPEEPAKALLLGCGDPRSILFTIYSRGVGVTFDLDFTCCDIESAILGENGSVWIFEALSEVWALARNVLLLSMLADDTTAGKNVLVWNAFYHLNLDRESYSLLLAQSRKLATLSESIEQWNDGPYGPFLRMCTRETLAQLRRHWEAYSGAEDLSRSQRKRLGVRFRAAMARARDSNGSTEGRKVDAANSAGPLHQQATSVVPAAYAHYWETGTTSSIAGDVAAATIPNPALRSACGKALALSWTSDPLLGYHIATAFATLKDTATPAPDTEGGFGHVVAAAQGEFAEWAKAFRDALTDEGCRVVIRIFSGDAVAFCKALHHRRASGSTESGYYSTPWMGHRLVLDGGDYDEGAVSKAPLMFNVIDTSTLAGRLGHLNILILATPLLVRSPSSTLFTETTIGIDENPVESFIMRMCGDIPAISLLFDLLPLAYATNFNTHSNAYGVRSLLFHGAIRGYARLFNERMAWKSVSLGDSIAAEHGSPHGGLLKYDPLQLSELMFDVYNRMFLPEETTNHRLVHYTRGTFAILLRLVKDRVQTDWGEFMTHLMDRIGGPLMFADNRLQELVTQLHIAGVVTHETPSSYLYALRTTHSIGIFRGWETVPPVVCVVLSVPRKPIDWLSDKPTARVILGRCKTKTPVLINRYSCVHPAFGTVKKEADGRVVLESDPEGWAGSSPLVLSFLVPSWTLVTHPDETSISFEIPMEMFGTPLGWCGFSANLTDDCVHVTPQWPNIPSGVETFGVSSFGRPAAAQPSGGQVDVNPVCVNLDVACEEVKTLTARVDIVGEVPKSELGGGAEVTWKQVSPCTILLTFGSLEQYLVFPFPVDGDRARARVARMSSYIEVIAPICGPLSPGGFSTKKFPVLNSPDPACWNIPYLTLARLPALSFTKQPSLTWLSNHFDLIYADREIEIRTTQPDLLIDVKASIQLMITFYTGLGVGRREIFELKGVNGVSTLIFPTDLRLDLASHTVVLDCCVMPVTKRVAHEAARHLGNLSDKALTLKIPQREHRAWADLMPAFVERCRTWKHTPACEYKRNGIPASSEQMGSPLCSCALGTPSEEFLKRPRWRPLAGFVARAAISPLFAVPWLEAVGHRKILKEWLLRRMAEEGGLAGAFEES